MDGGKIIPSDMANSRKKREERAHALLMLVLESEPNRIEYPRTTVSSIYAILDEMEAQGNEKTQ